MKKKLFATLIWFFILATLTWASPFIACDPYVPIGEETITDVEIVYTLEGTTYHVTGTYSVSGDHINLYDLNGADKNKITTYMARWSTDGGTTWSIWGGVRFKLKRPK